jgi:diguanylate cyclase (GGDEF)-like protein/PAS domain S-box-containing protein
MTKKSASNRGSMRVERLPRRDRPAAPAPDVVAQPKFDRMVDTMLGNLPGMVYRRRVDADGAFEFVSEGCVALTGYASATLLAGSPAYTALIHSQDRSRVEAETQAALAAHRPFDVVFRIVTADGATRWVWDQGRGVFDSDGTPLFVEGFIVDVSERKQTEESLRESEERFRALSNLSADWYWEGDEQYRFVKLEGRLVERDAALYRSQIGKSSWDLGIWIDGAENAEDNKNKLLALFERHEPYYNIDMYMQSPDDGSRIYLSSSAQPRFDANGRFIGYRGVTRNVTKRKLAEQHTLRLGRMYAALSATNEAILRARSAAELYQKVCDAAVHGGKFISTAVLAVSPEANWLTVLASTGLNEEHSRRVRISVDASRPEGQGMVGTAYRTRRPAVCNNYFTDPRMAPWREAAVAMGVTSTAAIPLLEGGTVVGVLGFYSDEVDAFDEEIVKLLERMGENVSFALDHFVREHERRLAEQATLRLTKMYAVLSATNEAILRAGTPDELYQKVCDAAVHGGKFISASAMVIEPGADWAKVVVMSGAGAEQWRRISVSVNESYPEGRGLVGTAYRTRRPGITNDYMNDERLRPWRDKGAALGVNAAAAIPILHGERVTGELLFYSTEKGAFDDEIVKLLERMAENVSFALDNFTREQEQRLAEQALRDSEERFKSLTELSSDWYWEQDAEFRFIRFDGRYVERSRGAFERLLGRRPWECGLESDPDQDMERTHRVVLERRRTFHNALVHTKLADGERVFMMISGTPIFDADGNFTGYRGTGRDVTARMRADAEMQKLSSAMEQTADTVMITNREGVIEYVNAAFERTTGYARGEAVGRKPSLLKSGEHGDAFYHKLWRTVLAGEIFMDVFTNRQKSGALYHEEKTISPLRDERGNITHFISTGKDITERMEAQERLQHIAHHDALTGLPNRVLLLDRLDQALARAHWQQRVVGVMFLDLDRFKNVNDTLGHDVGDALLKAMAARLQGCVRERDSVARLGGDEFAILLEDVAHAEDISGIAGKILGAFASPFSIQSHELFITTSIGISMYPNDGTSSAALLKNADAAMYRAKDLGKNNYQFYSADMGTAAFERLTLETSLRRALERDEFVIHYQPQVDIQSGHIIGVEALLRWQHPDFGLLAPMQFISIAEETGAIVPIGEWVARSAMLQTVRWRKLGFPLRVAVNVSSRQFNEPSFLETIAYLLEETGLPPEALELEITESVIMKNAEVTIERLQALHAMGVRFAIDDFGTGYSSLSYLRRFAIHTLKVDKSFVRDIVDGGDDVEIVKTIIMMARGLRLSVVAEGVETREQLMFLKSHGCHAAQGNLISRPLSLERMTERLHQARLSPWVP